MTGGAGTFVVNARHAYARNGHFTVSVTVTMTGPTWARTNGSAVAVVTKLPKHQARVRVIHRVLKKPAKPAKDRREVDALSRKAVMRIRIKCVALVTISMELSTMTKPIRVAVTGAGGQIGYALLFRLASGAAFGPDQPISLQLLEITPALPALDGTLMELEDCAFPLLSSVIATDKAEQAFDGADWVVLVGGLPRKEGQSRADLIRANSPIFTGQGKAINSAAGPAVRVLTVANPCNTNCLIARSHSPKVPSDRWFAMTRLDQNRAAAVLAKKAGVPVERGQPDDDLGQSQRHAVS